MLEKRYRIDAELGRGGMGVVYRAYDRLLGQPVALKRIGGAITDTKGSESDVRETLAREFQTLASLRHPNLIGVLDYGFDDGRAPYFTMELLEAPRLFDDAIEGLDVPEKVRYLWAILQALAYVHRRGIVHRDLKPANILVTSGNVVKVLDFGISQKPGGSTQLAGTIPYMPPEIIQQAAFDHRADLYAFGVMAFQAFAGRLPFATDNLANLAADILYNEPDYSPLDLGAYGDIQPVIARLLAKEADDRYQTAEDAIAAFAEAIGKAAPQDSVEIRESYLQAAAFVGRTQELQQLQAALRATRHGSGCGWLVGGESGVGKSRLVDELRIQALGSGVQVLHGQAATGGRPYQLWREIMRRAILNAPLDPLEAGILKEIVPDIAELLGQPVPDAPALGGAAGQVRLFTTIADVLRRQTTPTLVLLEDLQWASDSLGVLGHLLRDIGALPMMVVGNYRNDESPALPDEVPQMQVISLERLSQTEIAALSRSILGPVGEQPALLALLEQETEGNIFFVVEVVRALAETAGQMAEIGSDIAELPTRILTGGMQDLLRRRLDRLSATEKEWLGILAVAGRQIDLSLMAHLIDIDESAHKEFLRRCINTAVFDLIDNNYRFAHDKLREAVQADIPAEALPPLHRQIARAIETVYPDDDGYNEALLDHWRAAGDTERELHYSLLVAEQVINIASEYGRGRKLVERIFALLGEDDKRLAKAHNLMCEAQRREGYSEEAQHHAEKGYELAQKYDDTEQLMVSLTRLGNLAERAADFDQAMHYYDDMLRIATEHNNDYNIMAAHLEVGFVAMARGEFDEALARFTKMLAMARKLDDKQAIAVGLGNMGYVLREIDRIPEALDYTRQALKPLEEVGNKINIPIVLNNIGEMALALGDIDEAEEYTNRALAMRREMVDPLGMTYTLGSLAEIARLRGDLPMAIEHTEEAIRLGRQIQDPFHVGVHLVRLARLRIAAKDDEIAALQHEIMTSARDIDSARLLIENLFVLADYNLQQGDLTQAAHLIGLADAQAAADDFAKQIRAMLVDPLREGLGEAEFDNALAEGAKLDFDATIQRLIDAFSPKS